MATRPNTALDPLADKLRQVHTIPALVKYLHDELGWPVNVDDWEDNLFDWEPDELNLKAEHEVKVKSIKQLRPLVSGQPWGIFFVEFNKGSLPITVLRRVLNGLVPKGRATGGGHQTWAAHDLLFVSSFGESNSREIALAHFTDESARGDLPTLRVLGWDDDDTPMQLGYVAQTLRDKLRWPANTRTADDLARWRAQWSSAFSLGYGQVINDSRALALAMAELAKRIRRRVNTVLALESDTGHLRQMHKAFKDNLIADLSDDAFADMFAQTITYGLFTARASRSSGALVADNLADMVPSTNPFLKELLGSFLSAAGRARNREKRVDFDELGINEVVTVLRDVPMDAVLRSFNASKPGDDPVIHFYEDFLKAYDKAMRAKRGVFYTPSPVVQFIVRSVDEILKNEFGIEDGLASTITWGEMIACKPELQLPNFCTTATPFVQVLDPATGTGTFIVEVITQIHAHMLGKWAKQGKVTKAQWQPLWVEYVKQHLLPRLYAFELMMAPYAIAHMKIGLKLAETGYIFPEDGPRLNVFLTNALEPAHAINPGLEFEAPMLAREAAAANRVKEQLAATVVVGNPPYSLRSGNMGAGPRALIDRFRRVAGQEIKEKGALQFEKNLNDDYVKFFGLSDEILGRSGLGLLGFITNHSYLDNPTLRGLRYEMVRVSGSKYIIDLHGNTTKNESPPDDLENENVFEIKQGVAIGLFVRGTKEPCQIRHIDLWGSRSAKEKSLLERTIGSLPWVVIEPTHDQYFLIQEDRTLKDEYQRNFLLSAAMAVNGAGYITARDNLVVDFERDKLEERITAFKNSTLSDAALLEEFQVSAKDGWDLPRARKSLQAITISKSIWPTCYRPFDWRWVFFDSSLVWGRSWPTHKHMAWGQDSRALISTRLTKDNWDVAVANAYASHKCVSAYDTGNVFPLWLDVDGAKQPNFSGSFISTLSSVLGLDPTDYLPEDPTAPLNAEKIFHYLYAVLHSPVYRQRYAAFLRTDFPRVPIPGSRKVFDALVKLGAELVVWHLLEHQDATNIVAGSARSARATAWFGNDFSLAKVAEKSHELADVQGTDDKVGKVYINATSGFANVHQSIWQHTIGGYQVLHKWLDDRRKAGRSLSQDDITHWLRVYAALQATQKLMLQVDEAIEANGGWPGAFSQNHPSPDAATLAAEQMAQKEQLKAQKKAASATKKRAAYASPTGASSLFDDLEDLAGAARGPDHPKARATPAKAAGGANNNADWAAMCAIRAVLARAGADGLSRFDLIRQTARELGHARTSSRIATELESAVRRATKRGIAGNERGVLRLVARSIDGYDRAFLKQHLLSCLTKAWCDKSEVPLRFARGLGFARTGPKIEELLWSLMASLQRGGSVERQGRGVNVEFRKSEN
jgi:hypothetical protein